MYGLNVLKSLYREVNEDLWQLKDIESGETSYHILDTKTGKVEEIKKTMDGKLGSVDYLITKSYANKLNEEDWQDETKVKLLLVKEKVEAKKSDPYFWQSKDAYNLFEPVREIENFVMQVLIDIASIYKIDVLDCIDGEMVKLKDFFLTTPSKGD